jgi:hypothetical protein
MHRCTTRTISVDYRPIHAYSACMDDANNNRRRNRHNHETQRIQPVSNTELVSHNLAYWASMDAELNMATYTRICFVLGTDLIDYRTGQTVRTATAAEIAESDRSGDVGAFESQLTGAELSRLPGRDEPCDGAE